MNETLADALEALKMRIDYNFNTIMQMSMILEYTHILLEEHNIVVDDEKFAAFQKERIEQLQEVARVAQEEIENATSLSPDTQTPEEEIEI